MKYSLSDIKYKILQLDKPANYQEHKNYLTQIIDKSISELTFPSWMEVTAISNNAFRNCYNLTSVTIPDGVTSIGHMAFSQCFSLTSITIPDSVTIIDAYAFESTGYYNNSSNWENDVLYIGKHLITANNSLSGSYIIKEGTKLIASYAFSDCTSLESVTIPDSVTSICGVAFYNSALVDIHMNSITPPALVGTSVFLTTTTIHVPIGSGDTYKSATNWSSFADKIVEDIEI